MTDKNMEMARAVAEAVRREGGHTYYVGGCVRDRLLGRDNKDIDIEVHGIPVQTLEKILDSLGERLTMGADFGIMGLRGYELDIAMPRSETATGHGHKDFAVIVDPFLGEEKAARRRDFTMNALMEDVLTGEILDFFGGREDLQKGLIRHVNDRSYAEDPLRVFRAAQFAARFEYRIAEETRVLSSGIDVSALAGERVMGELEKALLKADRPSIFFEELRAMRQLGVWFPEVEALIGVPQNRRFHPEGDVWVHTMQVLDEAAALRDRAEHPLAFMLSALCHDFGKAVTTEEKDGVYHAYAHEKAGLPLAEGFLSRLTSETKLKAYVRNMVENHMRPNVSAARSKREKTFMSIFDSSCCPEDLLLLARADALGSGLRETGSVFAPGVYDAMEARLRAMLALYRQRMAEPCVMGQDLIDAGLKPGPVFGRALSYAHKLRLAGFPKEEQLRQTLAYIRKAEKKT